MGIFKRLFSSDYRAAVAAEAAGDLDLAAERYALAGQLASAVRMHLARADRAETRAKEIEALRDALHWAPEDGEWRSQASRRLGQALIAQLRAEGIATERDRQRVKAAAKLLEDAGDFAAAGDAYELIDADAQAAQSFKHGGLVTRMEAALLRQQRESTQERSLRDAFRDYEVAYNGGERDRARELLVVCVDTADDKAEYRRLLDDLESRLLTQGRVILGIRRGNRVAVCAGGNVVFGRDALCDVALRSRGVSRRHTQIDIEEGSGALRFLLSDAGSRNGTRIGDMPISGSIELSGEGAFALGDACVADYRVDEHGLRVTLKGGLDAGVVLRAAGKDGTVDLSEEGLPARVLFQDGRPHLAFDGERLTLNGDILRHVKVQLVRGDVVSIEGVEFEVLS